MMIGVNWGDTNLALYGSFGTFGSFAGSDSMQGAGLETEVALRGRDVDIICLATTSVRTKTFPSEFLPRSGCQDLLLYHICRNRPETARSKKCAKYDLLAAAMSSHHGRRRMALRDVIIILFNETSRW